MSEEFHTERYEIVIAKTKPGVISPEAWWTASEGGYMYDAESLPTLLQLMAKEWRHDRHIVDTDM